MDVLFQMTQRFPTSHMSVLMPTRTAPAAGSAATPPPDTNPDMDLAHSMGFQLVPLRRGVTVGATVGDVYPGSKADEAGIEPGWVIGTVSVNLSPKGATYVGHVAGTFVAPLTDKQKLDYDHDLRIDAAAAGGGSQTNALRTTAVNYDFPFDKPEIAFETKVLPGGVRYIRFDEFNAVQMDQVLAAIDLGDSHGLIIDLRSNHGGDGRERMRLLSRLLPAHTAFESDVGPDRRYTEYTDLFSRRYTGPVAVLIGPASASSAEVIPAALRDNHRAILVGRPTNGSVLGSQDFPLPDGGHVQIPVVDVVTSSGKHLEAVGVAPDIAVMPSLAAIRAGHDPALERAEAELAANRG
jgi:carboxyl-terminal processing protease